MGSGAAKGVKRNHVGRNMKMNQNGFPPLKGRASLWGHLQDHVSPASTPPCPFLHLDLTCDHLDNKTLQSFQRVWQFHKSFCLPLLWVRNKDFNLLAIQLICRSMLLHNLEIDFNSCFQDSENSDLSEVKQQPQCSQQV